MMVLGNISGLIGTRTLIISATGTEKPLNKKPLVVNLGNRKGWAWQPSEVAQPGEVVKLPQYIFPLGSWVIIMDQICPYGVKAAHLH